jgi:hypothetical protein
MARKPLRSQLNQIRAWAREGRTDAWIAHQLDVSASELKEFRRRHGLTADGGDEVADDDLRDEIEAEIEAATLTEDEDEADAEEAVEDAAPASEAGDGGGSPRRRRRRRRRGGRKRKTLQGTFDHGETDGFGLWLDPAIQDEPAYSEHWAGHRAVEVEVEADRIVIRRSE